MCCRSIRVPIIITTISGNTVCLSRVMMSDSELLTEFSLYWTSLISNYLPLTLPPFHVDVLIAHALHQATHLGLTILLGSFNVLTCQAVA